MTIIGRIDRRSQGGLEPIYSCEMSMITVDYGSVTKNVTGCDEKRRSLGPPVITLRHLG
jgi:hypothetical protein